MVTVDILGHPIEVDSTVIVAHPYPAIGGLLIADVTDVGKKWIYWEGVDVRGNTITSKSAARNVYVVKE